MFTAPLLATSLWAPFLTAPALRDSLDWIRREAAAAEEGIYELGEAGWLVNVHGYTTRPEGECQWENHRLTIDIQYLMAGEEGIRVAPVESLGSPIQFKPESDTEKFAGLAGPAHLVVLRPGDFAIFLPGEAHCPKIAPAEPAPLRKLVVKIPRRLLPA